MTNLTNRTDLAVYCVVSLPEVATISADKETLAQIKALALAHPVVIAIDSSAAGRSGDKVLFMRSNAGQNAFIADFIVRSGVRSSLTGFLNSMVPPETAQANALVSVSEFDEETDEEVVTEYDYDTAVANGYLAEAEIAAARLQMQMALQTTVQSTAAILSLDAPTLAAFNLQSEAVQAYIAVVLQSMSQARLSALVGSIATATVELIGYGTPGPKGTATMQARRWLSASVRADDWR